MIGVKPDARGERCTLSRGQVGIFVAHEIAKIGEEKNNAKVQSRSHARSGKEGRNTKKRPGG